MTDKVYIVLACEIPDFMRREVVDVHRDLSDAAQHANRVASDRYGMDVIEMTVGEWVPPAQALCELRPPVMIGENVTTL